MPFIVLRQEAPAVEKTSSIMKGREVAHHPSLITSSPVKGENKVILTSTTRIYKKACDNGERKYPNGNTCMHLDTLRKTCIYGC